MSNYPKSPHSRRGRTPIVHDWVSLPAEGRTSAPPPAPSHLGPFGVDWWRWAWRTPPATQWTRTEWALLTRRAMLEDLWMTKHDPRYLTEIRNHDTALGLTPKSRMELRWRVEPSTFPTEAEHSPPDDRRRRLRVVG